MIEPNIEIELPEITLPQLQRFSKKTAAFLLILGLVSVNYSVASPVYAYYNDVEASDSNLLAADDLDFILDESEWTPEGVVDDLDPGDSISKEIQIVDDGPDGSIDFSYRVRSIKTGGDDAICNQLELKAFLEETEVYDGPLLDFTSATSTFSTTTDEWRFDVILPEDASDVDDTTCQFDFIFEGWQEEFDEFPQGYHDDEGSMNLVQSMGRECQIIDFETDAEGNPILEGQILGDEYEEWGVTLSATSRDHLLFPNELIVFNSADPTGNDPDLGTPHEDFGGPGIGVGGQAGALGENNRALGHIAIIPEYITDDNEDDLVDDPNDYNRGGIIILEFDTDTWVRDITIMDVDTNAAQIRLYDKDDNETIGPKPLLYGDNSQQVVEIGEDGVRRMEIEIHDSFGVDEICVDISEPEEPEEEEPDPENDLPNVVLNEFLPHPDGEAYGFDFGKDHSDMPQGEWIELFNNEDHPVDLSGWYTRDATDGEGNRVFVTGSNTQPATTTIPAKGHLVVYMNKPILNNNTGDTVRLFNDDDILMDSYSYERDASCELEPTPEDPNDTDPSEDDCASVPPNKSFARIPDGVGDFVDPIPTPGDFNILEEEEEQTSEATEMTTSNVEEETLAPPTKEEESDDENEEDDSTGSDDPDEKEDSSQDTTSEETQEDQADEDESTSEDGTDSTEGDTSDEENQVENQREEETQEDPELKQEEDTEGDADEDASDDTDTEEDNEDGASADEESEEEADDTETDTPEDEEVEEPVEEEPIQEEEKKEEEQESEPVNTEEQ